MYMADCVASIIFRGTYEKGRERDSVLSLILRRRLKAPMGDCVTRSKSMSTRLHTRFTRVLN